MSARCARVSDKPALKALYQSVFGDDDASADLFFSSWFSPDLTIVIDIDGDLASMAYILPVGELRLTDDARYDCAMLYAIGTDARFRGRGLGEAVTRAAAVHAQRCGFSAVVLKPAEDSLFRFYDDRCGFKQFFDAHEQEFSSSDLVQAAEHYTLNPCSTEDYVNIRQACLKDDAYIDTSVRTMAYQAQLSEVSGGGLYVMTKKDGAVSPVGCAIIERNDNTLSLKELLVNKHIPLTAALAAVAEKFPAERYLVRSPCVAEQQDGVSCRRFGMLLPFSDGTGVPLVQSSKWYGPAFD